MSTRRSLLFKTGNENPFASKLLTYNKFHNSLVDEIGNTTPSATDESYGDDIFSGVANECIRLSAATSKVTIGNESFLNFGDGVTDVAHSFFTCIEVSTVNSINYIIRRGHASTGSNYDYVFFFGGGGGILKPIIQFRDPSTGGYLRVIYNTSLAIDTPYHIGYTYSGNGLASGIKMYLQGSGVTVIDQSSGSYTAMETNTYNTVLGNTPTVGEGLRGELNGTGFFNVELTASEVSDAYDIQSAGGDLI